VPGSLILGRPRALGRLPLRPLLPLRPQGKLSQTTALRARGGPGPAPGTPPGFQKLLTKIAIKLSREAIIKLPKNLLVTLGKIY